MLLYNTHEINCMKEIGPKLMCGFVFNTFKTTTEVIKHAEKEIIRNIQGLTKLLCDMRIKEFRGLYLCLCRRWIRYSLIIVSKHLQQETSASRKLFNLAQKNVRRSKGFKLNPSVLILYIALHS